MCDSDAFAGAPVADYHSGFKRTFAAQWSTMDERFASVVSSRSSLVVLPLTKSIHAQMGAYLIRML